eukprot:GHVP01043913.1.p1 GENE.GHVP01043913.1~~GHVP01043913.1.p1  ORF type:complete len:622 (+),score=100.52 GHVP01043913.1:34-1866(+)
MQTACYSRQLLDRTGNFSAENLRKAFAISVECWDRVQRFRGVSSSAVVTESRLDLDEDFENISDEEDQQSAAGSLTAEVPDSPPRLKLVLDLDNTLLHACAQAKLGGAEIDQGDFQDLDNQPELYKFALPQMATNFYYLKLRPLVRNFLHSVARVCDLAIHTNATREYADVVRAILDPERELFHERVAARHDESAKDHKKDLDKLFQERHIDLRDMLIIDDRKDVWDEQLQQNLVQCCFYEFFDSKKETIIQCYKNQEDISLAKSLDSFFGGESEDRQNNARSSAAILSELDTQLYWLQKLVIEIVAEHQRRWYKDPTFASAPDILREKKSSILKGTVILMTGLNKTETPSEFGMLDNGPYHRRRLEKLGATVVDRPTSKLTHVFMMRRTATADKIRQTRGSDVFYVHALWLTACEATWSKVEESNFDAALLLKIYEDKPPKAPHFEHWKYLPDVAIKLREESDLSRRKQKQTEEDNSRRKRRKMLPSWSAEGSDNLDSNLDLDLDSDRKSEDNNAPERASDSSPPREIEWIASAKWSDGGEIWSASEHITIKYDSVKSQDIVDSMHIAKEKSNALSRLHSRYRKQFSVCGPKNSSFTEFRNGRNARVAS